MHPFLKQFIHIQILHIRITGIIKIHFLQGIYICEAVHFRMAAVQALEDLDFIRRDRSFQRRTFQYLEELPVIQRYFAVFLKDRPYFRKMQENTVQGEGRLCSEGAFVWKSKTEDQDVSGLVFSEDARLPVSVFPDLSAGIPEE